jgi:60 kDa SS-A/Ro ribonucleoprotein
MANKKLFKSKSPLASLKPADTVNSAGGKAYKMTDKHALAQYAVTGCFNSTYYTSADVQLQTVLDLATKVDPAFLAKVAVYAHQKSFMKDVPALLTAVLASRDDKMLRKVFSRTIDSGNMLRSYAQMLKSGVTGRSCLGTASRKQMSRWFADRTPDAIFHQSIGNDPTLGDVIRLVHAKPATPAHAALFAYLCGAKAEEVEGRKVLRIPYLDRVTKEQKYVVHDYDALPELVRQFEAWKADNSQPMPKLNFRFLDGAGKLSQDQWKEIVTNANWLTSLKNLAAWSRRGVFADSAMVKMVAARLRDPALIKKARAFPYQIMMAYLASDAPSQYTRNWGQTSASNATPVPTEIKNALQDAMEVATQNVPKFSDEGVFVCNDVSGSMSSPVTGDRGTATTNVKCIQVAALVAACVLRNNPHGEVIPFSDNVVERDRNGQPVRINPRDSVMSNAEKLANLPSGGTNCSAPLRLLNDRKAKGKVVIYVSDYESWVDNVRSYGDKATAMMEQWEIFRKRNPGAKLVCIDLTPRTNSQTSTRKDILQVGGFSDNVFNVIDAFLKANDNEDYWVDLIEKSISLEDPSFKPAQADVPVAEEVIELVEAVE